MNQHRLKSKVVWMAVAAQLVGLLMALGLIDTGLGDAVNAAAGSLCELLVLFGVLNNPTDGSAF